MKGYEASDGWRTQDFLSVAHYKSLIRTFKKRLMIFSLVSAFQLGKNLQI